MNQRKRNLTEFALTIRRLRDRAGLSQQDVADAVGIARATYVKLENGGREPKQSEILKLARYYEVSPLTIMTGAYIIEEPAPVYKRNANAQSESAEDKLLSKNATHFNPQKLREVLLYVADRLGAKSQFGESVLYKLLYCIDYNYYDATGQSITGLAYIRNYYGPVPSDEFKEVVENMKAQGELEVVETKHFKNLQKKYLPVIRPVFDQLNGAELNHMSNTLDRLGNKTAAELSELVSSTRTM